MFYIDFLLSEKSENISYDENSNIKSTTPSESKNSLIHRHLINESENGSTPSVNTKASHKWSPKMNDSFLQGASKETDKYEASMPNFCENCLKKFDNSPYSNYSQVNMNIPIRCYKGEKRKTLVSMIYLFVSGLWTSFILTVVHNRVPDMAKYPPLPDLILDNVPLIPWAFFASEAIGVCLLVILSLILVFHKYR